jgi:hypothetical protein
MGEAGRTREATTSARAAQALGERGGRAAPPASPFRARRRGCNVVHPLPVDMTDSTSGRRVLIVAAVLMTLTTLAHSLGILAVGPMFASTTAEQRAIVTMLWFGGAFDFGLVAAAAWLVVARRLDGSPMLLAVLAAQPLGIAILQVVFLGFSAPTAMLLLDATLLGLAARVTPHRRSTAASHP